MDLEHRLSTMLGESVHDLPVPVAVIVAEAGHRGRRLRLRRRAIQLAATVTAAAGLVWGSAVIDLHPHLAAPAVGRPADPVGRSMLGTLAELLPSGASLRQVAEPLDPAAETGLTVAYDNGRSPVTVTVALYGPGSTANPEGCEARSRTATKCSVTRADDGKEQVTEVHGSPGNALAYSYDIQVTQPDGREVQVSVRGDSPSPAASLTLAQWQKIARSPQWAFPMPVH